MSAHTPGPWVVLDYAEDDSHVDIMRADKSAYIAMVPRNQFDAYLLAAAPDLLAVVEEAIRLYGKPGGPWNIPSDPGGWINRAQDAVAKARGGER